MIEQQYIDLFNSNRSEIDANSSKGLNKHRDAAFEAFSKLGFPTSRLEDYKNTNIARLFDAELGVNTGNTPVQVNPYETFECDVPNLDTHLYFLVNDRYYENGDREAAPLEKKVFAGSLRRFSEEHPKLFKKHYAQIAQSAENGIAAYNTMFA